MCWCGWQLLERDRNAVVSRSASLQQRLDALRNRNSQLKQKVQQLEKRLERHADDAEKLDKLTMELAIAQNRLSHSPRRDSPTRGLQSYMRAHDVRLGRRSGQAVLAACRALSCRLTRLDFAARSLTKHCKSPRLRSATTS